MAKIVFDGDASGAVRAQDAVTAAQGRQNEAFKQTAKSAKELDRTAQALLKANESGQERYNRRLAEATELFKRGRISADDLAKATARYRMEAEKAGDAGNKAFGGAATSIKDMVMNLGAVLGPLALMKRGLDDITDSVNKAKQASAESRISVGTLRQLASTDQEFQSLKSKSEALFGTGGARSLDEAAGSVFALKSAGLLDDQSFALFAALAQKGVLADVPGAARSVSAYGSAYGAAESGTAQQILQKGFAAAQFSPASVEQLLATQARVGAVGSAQGLKDEELLAANAVLSASVGAETAATLNTQLLAATGRLKGFEGLDYTQRIEKLQSLNLTQPELQAKLGSVEAATAFSLASSNLGAINKAEADIVAANNDPAAVVRRLNFIDPESDAALQSQISENQSILANRRDAAFSAIRDADRERVRQELRDFGKGGIPQRLLAAVGLGTSYGAGLLEDSLLSPETYVAGAQSTRRELQDGGLTAGQREVVDALNRTAKASEATAREIEKLSRRRPVAARPE